MAGVESGRGRPSMWAKEDMRFETACFEMPYFAPMELSDSVTVGEVT